MTNTELTERLLNIGRLLREAGKSADDTALKVFVANDEMQKLLYALPLAVKDE